MNPAFLPPIAIGLGDFDLLQQLVAQALEDRHPIVGFLAGELERADIQQDAAPYRNVRLNEWVTYRADKREPLESRLLVLPETFRGGRLHVSVLSALGAALVGLPVGASMRYVGIDGVWRTVTVESLDPPAGVVSLQQRRVMKSKTTQDSGTPDRPGPTAA